MNKKLKKSKFWKKDDVATRYKYVDHSRKFLDWVNQFGFEKTILGRLAYLLDEKFKLRQVALLFLYCLSLSFLLFYDFEVLPITNVGRVATADIKSPISFSMVDEVATEEKRKEAEESVPPVFDYDPDVYENIFNQVYKSFWELRKLTSKMNWPTSDVETDKMVRDFLVHKPLFEELLGRKVSHRIFEWLVEKRFNVHIEKVVTRALTLWSTEKIADIPINILSKKDVEVILREVQASSNVETTEDSFTIPRAELKNIRRNRDFDLSVIEGVKSFSKTDQRILTAFVKSLMIPNVTYNLNETTERRRKARESVLPVQISIKKNQTIVNEGSVIQPLHITIFNEIQKRKDQRRRDFIVLITALLFVVLTLVFFSYLRRFSVNKVFLPQKDLMAMALVALLVISITKVFLFVAEGAFAQKFGSLIPLSFFLYSAPLAAAPMLVGLLITSGEVVWIFTSIMSVSLAIMVDNNFTFFLLAFIGGVAAARGVFACKSRNDIYRAGLRTGAINAIVIALMLLVATSPSDMSWREFFWSSFGGFVGGMMSSMVAIMLIPVMESLFNYTTDVKLLELSNLNHPLLQDMAVKARGTYHHCLVVGSMVESAAQKIGANPLMAKVMAYYHDIGKTNHPQYFIENQRPGYNPHDHLSPFMSKTVLVAHVKDGAEMGLRHKLGKPIIDAILQHHGTSLIRFFYHKALESQDEEISQVSEEDFRYPGPKPQYKETALVMLADAIEATARSLDEPTTTRLKKIVTDTIQNKFVDGQLDECNLTFEDLSNIAGAFEHALLGIYHHRLDYPTLPPKQSSNQNELLTKVSKINPQKKKSTSA